MSAHSSLQSNGGESEGEEIPVLIPSEHREESG